MYIFGLLIRKYGVAFAGSMWTFTDVLWSEFYGVSNCVTLQIHSNKYLHPWVTEFYEAINGFSEWQ